MAEFLLEIGLEEVPARMLPGAEAELLRRVVALLERTQLLPAREQLLPERAQLLPAGTTLVNQVSEVPEVARSFSTPRRLAVLCSAVLPRQPDRVEETTGPAVKIAFKDGQPTAAAEAFARKSGLAVAELGTISTPRGDYLCARSVKRGRAAADVLAADLPREIGSLYWAKSMYWRAGKPERFVRPVLWLTCLLDEQIVPLQFAGRQAGRVSFGHRVLSSGEPFEVVSPSSYTAQLRGESVLPDVEARRHRIRKALDRVTREIDGARWREDEPLVDAVTHLTEWPTVLRGSFDAEFLALPQEVLVTVMRDHQKYFAVEDAQGTLLPHFLTVLNLEADAASEGIIRQGNERVLRARFNDARFFWNFDQRLQLAQRRDLLNALTFHKDLEGSSYASKSDRMEAIARALLQRAGEKGARLDSQAVLRAIELAKTDLPTELVKEFTELQGVIGGLYARAQAESTTVAEAIYDQYLPASAGDRIPRSAEGAVLGLADRIDTLAELFALGMEPTGSKDPFALRRAANAVVRLLAESSLPLALRDVVGAATAEPANEARLNVFFSERIDFYLREVRGQAYDVVKAVMVVGSDDLRDLVARAEAVSAMRGSADFEAVSAALKRMTKILEQAVDRGEDLGDAVEPTLFSQPEERALYEASEPVLGRVRQARAQGRYVEALGFIATLRPQVDDFFNAVMVMAPQPELRRNRLALLSRMVREFSQIADFSEIVVTG